MIRLSKILAATVLTGMVTTNASANCDLVMTVLGETAIHQYNGFETGAAAEDIRLNLLNTGDSLCQGKIVFDNLQGEFNLRNRRGEALSFNIAKDRSLNEIVFDSKLQNLSGIEVRIPPRETVQLTPVFVIPPHQPGSSGLYENQLLARFKNQVMSEIDVETILPVSVHISPVVQANFIGVSRAGRKTSSLDLGELYPGLEQNFGLQLRSNSYVDLQITSENRGVLQHVTDDNSKIPYQLYVGGEDLNLSQAETLTLPARLTHNGTTNPVQIKINEFSEVAAGDYSDTILIRISAR